MAKKRVRRRRTTHHSVAPHRRRRGGSRRSSSGGGYGIKPSGDDIKLMIGAAAYGKAEQLAKSDAEFVLNKVPKPIDVLGFTGNIALILWGLSVLTKNRLVRVGARSTAIVASYQFGARGKLYDKADEHFTLQGWSDQDVAQAIEDQLQGEMQLSGINPMGVEQY